MKDNVRIGLVQLDTGLDWEKNKQQAERWIAEAVKEGAELVILPEHSDAIGLRDALLAQAIPGPVTEFYRELAIRFGVYLHLGSMTEEQEGGNPFNTSLLFSPKGEILGKYRKLHLFDAVLPDGTLSKESAGVAYGDHVEVVGTELCRMGLSICYDIRFPELYREMALDGAELLVVSANFTAPTGAAHWEPILRTRAIENGCYLAAVNQCGRKKLFEAYGHTMLIDPWGRILGELGTEPGILVLDMKRQVLEDTRSRMPSLQHMRIKDGKLSKR